MFQSIWSVVFSAPAASADGSTSDSSSKWKTMSSTTYIPISTMKLIR